MLVQDMKERLLVLVFEDLTISSLNDDGIIITALTHLRQERCIGVTLKTY